MKIKDIELANISRYRGELMSFIFILYAMKSYSFKVFYFNFGLGILFISSLNNHAKQIDAMM